MQDMMKMYAMGGMGGMDPNPCSAADQTLDLKRRTMQTGSSTFFEHKDAETRTDVLRAAL